MQFRATVIVMFASFCAPQVWAGEALRSVLEGVAKLEKDVRAVEPGDGHAVGRCRASAHSLLARLNYVKKFDERAAETAHTIVLALARHVETLDTPGNLPIDIVDPPKRENVPNSPGGQSSFDRATRQKLDTIKARYFSSSPKELHAGDRLAFTQQHTLLLAKECHRFVQEFQTLKQQWELDKRTVRNMRATGWNEGLRYHLEQDLNFSIPDGINSQLWRSRWYLKAACHGAFRRVKEEAGLQPIVIINTRGRDAITWESGASKDDIMRFAHQAALIGAAFEQGIDGDPSPWLEKKKEIEETAKRLWIKLEN